MQDNKFINGLKKAAKCVWEYIKKAKIEYLVIILAIVVDLVTKAVIQANMKEGETVVLIPTFLEFYFTYNKAAAFSFDFGMGGVLGQQGVTVVFIITTFLSIGLFGFILYKLRNRKLWARIAFALVIGGAIGNLYDRMAFSMVRDFIRIVYFGYDIPYLGRSFAVFNIADACLVVGVIMYIVYVLFMETKDKKSLESKVVTVAENEQSITDTESAQGDVCEPENGEIDEKSDTVTEISEQNGAEQ